MWQMILDNFTWPILKVLLCVGPPSLLFLWSAKQIAEKHPALRPESDIHN